MIAVVGLPTYWALEAGAVAHGVAARIALSAAAHGRSVQLVGKMGDDPEGDAVLLALTRGGVGHAAVLREAGLRTSQVIGPVDAGLDDLDADGHDALTPPIRDAVADGSTGLDAADIDLALRYLTEFSVVVLAVPADPQIARVVAAAVGWVGARLIAVVPARALPPDDLPPDAIVFEAPDEDPDGVFAELVGAFAAALDDGDDPAVAFRSTVEAEGWTPLLHPT